MTQDTNQTRTSPRRPWRRIAIAALAGSLGAGVGMAALAHGGGFGGGFGPGGRHMDRGGQTDPDAMKRRIDASVRWMLADVNATDAQREKIAAIVEATRKEMAPLREKHREARRAVMDLLAKPTVDRAAIEAIRDGRHGYTPSAGIDALREAAAHYLGRMRGVAVAPDEVVVGAGAKPFIAYSILSTTDYGVGDEVIYPNPGFPIYESQIKAHGAVPVPLPLREARNFAFDPADLEARLSPRTKLLILNSPHNPTGGILARKDLEDIAAILRRHPAVWVYADEIYSRLCYEGEFASIASLPGMYERTIICDGASKTWAMTGWRLGFASNPVLAEAMARARDGGQRAPSAGSGFARRRAQPSGSRRRRRENRGQRRTESLDPRVPRRTRRPAQERARIRRRARSCLERRARREDRHDRRTLLRHGSRQAVGTRRQSL